MKLLLSLVFILPLLGLMPMKGHSQSFSNTTDTLSLLTEPDLKDSHLIILHRKGNVIILTTLDCFQEFINDYKVIPRDTLLVETVLEKAKTLKLVNIQNIEREVKHRAGSRHFLKAIMQKGICAIRLDGEYAPNLVIEHYFNNPAPMQATGGRIFKVKGIEIYKSVDLMS